MDNEKLFKDISLEAQEALRLLAGVSDGTVSLKKLRETIQRAQKHIENVMNACPYGESTNEKS